jgi:hypothetical protein
VTSPHEELSDSDEDSLRSQEEEEEEENHQSVEDTHRSSSRIQRKKIRCDIHGNAPVDTSFRQTMVPVHDLITAFASPAVAAEEEGAGETSSKKRKVSSAESDKIRTQRASLDSTSPEEVYKAAKFFQALVARSSECIGVFFAVLCYRL